ncbi:hypothetical protein PIB30_033421 [Stylosanthes scabra]|uniref:Uncharacterized protein n=1 Tax=Stylosanthes scabra TaxID=79078 RepID=A0ABU6SDA3_9FABA|nr:hypothetical protein [Stylosanthes scabra]
MKPPSVVVAVVMLRKEGERKIRTLRKKTPSELLLTADVLTVAAVSTSAVLTTAGAPSSPLAAGNGAIVVGVRCWSYSSR